MLAFLLASGLARAAGPVCPIGDAEALGWPVHVGDHDLAPLQPIFHSAAAEFGVPEPLLLAMGWEASRWEADVTSQWGGYGIFDLQEDDAGPGPRLEDAAELLGISPDRIIAEPRQQVRAAAALLARSARAGHDGSLPQVDELSAWWTAVESFSGRDEPGLGDMYARYIFDVVGTGASRGGLVLRPVDVDLSEHADLPPPPTTCDYSGCYQFVSASTSNYSDYSRGAADIDYIIIHTVQGSYSGCISWFQNSSAAVSAHYVVRSSDGQVTQMVREQDVAWHAGNWDYNLASVGIEHEGYVDDPGTWYTSAMYAGSAALTSDICARNSIPVDRSHILGHVEVPGSTHTDPGSGWDWDYYMSLLSGGAVTGDLIGAVADSDIYSGTRLIGATAWIAETGETTIVDSDGYYRFYDLPLDGYTVWASYPGYLDGSCTKTLSTGTNWCSIALTPDPGGDGGADGGSVDTGADGGSGDDTGTTADGGTDGGTPGGDEPPGFTVGTPPGTAVPLDGLSGGCGGCSGSPASATWGLSLLGLLGLAARRRR